MSVARFLCGLCCLVPLIAEGAFIQYHATTRRVTGVSDAAIVPFDGRPVIELPEPMASMVWPIPSGCTVGHPAWTVITDPDQVTAAGAGMAVDPSLGFLPTNSAFGYPCHAMASAEQVDTYVEERARQLENNRGRSWKSVNNFIVQTREQCPTGQDNTTCVESRTSADAIQASIINRAQLSNYGARLAELVTQAEALKLTKGWTD